GAGSVDRGHETGPIDVIRQGEATVERAPAAGPAYQHPARGEAGGMLAEATYPGGAVRRRRCDDDRAAASGAFHRRGVRGGWERDTRRAIRGGHPLYGAVGKDRPDRGIEAGQKSLSLAEGVAVEERSATGVLVRAPPPIHLVQH